MKKLIILILLFFGTFFLPSCGGWDPQSSREIPTIGPERAKKILKKEEAYL